MPDTSNSNASVVAACCRRCRFPPCWTRCTSERSAPTALESTMDRMVATYLRWSKQTTIRETRKLEGHQRNKSKIQSHSHLKIERNVEGPNKALLLLSLWPALCNFGLTGKHIWTQGSLRGVWTYGRCALHVRGQPLERNVLGTRLDRCHRCVGVACVRGPA